MSSAKSKSKALSESPSSALCEGCRSPKIQFHCPLCQVPVCGKCGVEPPRGAFQLKENAAPELKHLHYCPKCYTDRVEPEVAQYAETLNLAREVFVFFVTQRKGIPLLKKAKETIRVADQEDRDESILKLAFMAAERGYNAIIETDVKAVKKRNEGWQSNVWGGTAIPAQVDPAKMERQY